MKVTVRRILNFTIKRGNISYIYIKISRYEKNKYKDEIKKNLILKLKRQKDLSQITWIADLIQKEGAPFIKLEGGHHILLGNILLIKLTL